MNSSMRPQSPASSPRRYSEYDMTACASQNCRQPVATKPVDSRHNRGYAAEMPSRWCHKHTCGYFFRSGQNCQLKKTPHDSVCVMHTKCSIQGCILGKLQVIDSDPEDNSPRYVRYDLCGDHKCAVPRCPDEKSSADGKNGYLPYCRKHRCHYHNCEAASSDKVNFCPKHKCKAPDCRTLSEDGYELCPVHVVCEIPNCSAVKAEDKTKDGYHKFCARHVRCDAPKCEAMKANGSKFCGRHTCLERGCNKSADKRRYCEDHRCISSGCENPRGWDQKAARTSYCPMHTCRSDDCFASVYTYALYCKNHECDNPWCLAEAVWDHLCAEHLKLKYENQAKAKARSDIDELTRQLQEKERILTQFSLRPQPDYAITPANNMSPVSQFQAPLTTSPISDPRLLALNGMHQAMGMPGGVAAAPGGLATSGLGQGDVNSTGTRGSPPPQPLNRPETTLGTGGGGVGIGLGKG